MATVNDYVVKPVYKALQVLQCLGDQSRKMTLTEISHQVRLPKTTVFRYLYTFRECGFVAHDPEADLYWLGLRIFELAQAVDEQLQIREVARPYMKNLRDKFNETINLGMMIGQDIVYLEMIESKRSLRMHAQPGSRDLVYSTSLGKAILAFTPEAQWANHLPREFVPLTPHTHISLDSLKQDLLETKARGFSLDLGENEEGACCIGVPVFNHLGRPAAALSLSAPAQRLKDDLTQQVATALIETAVTISHQLGYQAN